MSAQPTPQSSDLREVIRRAHIGDETTAVKKLVDYLSFSEHERDQLVDEAAELVRILRRSKNPGLMETFLSEYGLSTEEGVALMCLAEALLRVPDEDTIDVLIRDKISAADWSRHLGHSTSPLVNASTWALMLTGKVISPQETESWDVVNNIRHLIRRAGEPVVRKAVAQSMKILGHQFVLGRTIGEAVDRAGGMEKKGYQYSYDMLGEAAHTAEDAKEYFLSYSRAISKLSERSMNADIRDNPGISVKLSALHPRYEYSQKSRVMTELVPRVASLVLQAKNAQMGFNIDAEEADRLDLSLDVIEAVLSEPDLAGWDGFGIVVQAYGPRAFALLDWCYDLAQRLDRKIMIRLVKGAYWDTEIKIAQVEGLDGYPVFTRKTATDISYMACAKKLLSMTDRIYPQFATHNAHSIATVLKLAGENSNFEFQRLHGMGEALHSLTLERYNVRCRIYAPVGVHQDLLAYLVRRLLENGANSSFVNQVLDEKVPARQVVSDPIFHHQALLDSKAVSIPAPLNIYPQNRQNSKGINFANPSVLGEYEKQQQRYQGITWKGAPVIAGQTRTGLSIKLSNPANLQDHIGEVLWATPDDVIDAIANAKQAQPNWASTPLETRAKFLCRIADLLEENRSELMALLCREAGKTAFDALGEVREAADFCRYYAQQSLLLSEDISEGALGVFVCISPWNFPLAIFCGQIVAALVTGNAVLAKPAEQTPLIAAFAIRLMLDAGIPGDILHLLPGSGAEIGQALVSSPDISGVCFTGSTATAQKINQSMARHVSAVAPLIAETGGLNAMIVDSTALPEQAVRDIVASAFQSAGQRCSALRILYVQEDIADRVLEMLKGAMEELIFADPGFFSTDAGPVIDAAAQQNILKYCQDMESSGRLIKKLSLSAKQKKAGYFVPPAVFSVSGIEELEREIFGPVLHFATYKSGKIEKVINAINNAGYGLTMGLHTRVDSRVQEVADQVKMGNLYVNRNQIGAVVGLQPFGGEGLSGTGPKAGGPLYLHKFTGTKGKGFVENKNHTVSREFSFPQAYLLNSLEKTMPKSIQDKNGVFDQVWARLAGYSGQGIEFKGPTGESNRLQFHARGEIYIDGENWLADSLIALVLGNFVLLNDKNLPAVEFFHHISKNQFPDVKIKIVSEEKICTPAMGEDTLAAVCLSGIEIDRLREIRKKLSLKAGPIRPILRSGKSWREYVSERTLSVDTTASGGNAALLASVEG